MQKQEVMQLLPQIYQASIQRKQIIDAPGLTSNRMVFYCENLSTATKPDELGFFLVKPGFLSNQGVKGFRWTFTVRMK